MSSILALISSSWKQQNNIQRPSFLYGDWRDSALALLCAAHPRLGANSYVGLLSWPLLADIAALLEPTPHGIVLAGSDTLQILNFRPRNPSQQKLGVRSPAGPVRCVCVCGQRCAFGANKLAFITELYEPETISLVLSGHEGHVVHIAMNSKYVATVADDLTIRFWDTQTGSCLRVVIDSELVALPKAITFVSSELFAFDNGSDTTTVVSISLLDSSRHHSLTGISPDARGSTLYMVGPSLHGLRIWDATSSEEDSIEVLHTNEAIYSMCVDASVIALGHKDGSISLYDPNSLYPLEIIRPQTLTVSKITLTVDSIVSLCEKTGILKVTDKQTLEATRTIPVPIACPGFDLMLDSLRTQREKVATYPV